MPSKGIELIGVYCPYECELSANGVNGLTKTLCICVLKIL